MFETVRYDTKGKSLNLCLGLLRVDGYVESHLIKFSRQNKLGDEFSGNPAARFVEEYCFGDEEVDETGERWRRPIVFGVQVLADFAQHGRIGRARADIEEIHLRPATKKVLRDYEQYGKDRLQLRPAALQKRTGELTILLDFLSSRKARPLDQIQALDRSEFLSFRSHLKPNTVSRIVYDIRSFLRFLTMRGILQKDLSAELPTIRVPRDAGIPSVWDHELIIKKLFGAIDRSSAKGKRDYAILLLAGDAVLLSVLYDTGARVQELIDLSAGDVRLDPPAQVRLVGKGRKMRAVPLMKNTVQLLRDHMHGNHLDRPEQFDRPLSRSGRDQRLSRSGIRYILQKHVEKARSKRSSLNRANFTINQRRRYL